MVRRKRQPWILAKEQPQLLSWNLAAMASAPE
jgi:hypothetical protein